MGEKVGIKTAKKLDKSAFFQNVIIALLSIVIFFGIGEIIFRAVYPEYRGYILTENITYGKRMYKAPLLEGETRVRSADSITDLNPGDHVVLVFGDSVTFGYGLVYEDIFWSYWQRMLKLEGSNTKVLAITKYGNNVVNIFKTIRKTIRLAKEKELNVDGVIYQFNFNDVLPFKAEDLKDLKHIKNKNSGITKIILKLVYLRTMYLNHSVMLRVLSNKLTHLLFSNKNVPCEDLGYDGLGYYTYSFGGRNSKAMASKLWGNLEQDLTSLLLETKQIPFVLLVTPIPQFLEPEMSIHSMSRPKRFDCATINPIERLEDISQKLNFHLVNPTDYMKEFFENSIQEQNPQRFYHINDDNHPNEIGSKYFSEYSYIKIFREGLVPSEKRVRGKRVGK